MNHQKRIAKEFGEELKEIKEVRALLLIGSVGKGWNDKYSDIDIIAFCKKFPNSTKLKKLYQKRNIALLEEHNLPKSKIWMSKNIGKIEKNINVNPYIFHILRYKNELIEGVMYTLAENFESTIKAAKEAKVNAEAVKDISEGKIIFDKDGLIRKWRKEIRPIPENLRRNFFIKKSMVIENFYKRSYRNAVKRKKKFFLNLGLFEGVKNLIQILMVLNEKYPSEDTWLIKEFNSLEYKPVEMNELIKKCTKSTSSIKELERRHLLLRKSSLKTFKIAKKLGKEGGLEGLRDICIRVDFL